MEKGQGKMTIYVLIGIVVAAVVGFSAPLITKKNDTVPEEFAEAYIYRNTGKTIDFSPSEQDTKADNVSPDIIE